MTEAAPLDRPVVVDAAQLNRIEAVHRGFLYQHLYAVRTLLLVPGTDVSAVVVESDEDVEIVRPDGRTYVQLKSRQSSLGFSDIADALARFDGYRALHISGERSGVPIFIIATNAALTPSLADRIKAADWPSDVRVDHPDAPPSPDPVTPPPPANLQAAFLACSKLGSRLPFAVLSPETLIWKLAGAVMLAAAGGAPRSDHAFRTEELTTLFEQLVVQLQDLPSPPATYRSQVDEPPLITGNAVRLITGYSGAGKTAWVSQAAIHVGGAVTYFDLHDTPGPALASNLARELAAKHFGGGKGGLGTVLLPGASGIEILQSLSRRVDAADDRLTIILDNAHSPPPEDVKAVILAAPSFRFVLLAQPGRNAEHLTALLQIQAESLQGWSPDTIAAEAAERGCRADAAACQALLALTGGLPLYIRNAISIAAAEHGGSVADLCDRLLRLTHSVETAQELILARIVEALTEDARRGLAVLSLSDVPLARGQVVELLRLSLLPENGAAERAIRVLRTAGIIDVFGGERLKAHDAIRLVGRAQLAVLGADAERLARQGLRDVVRDSMTSDWEPAKVALYVRMLAELGDIKTLVQFAGEELFHELGLWPIIKPYLEAAAASDQTDPEARFWALDGIVFNDMRVDAGADASECIRLMKRLVAEHGLGSTERLSVGMKEMNVLARERRAEEALAVMLRVASELSSHPSHQRIFRYNAAVALFQLGDHATAAAEALKVAMEYYDLLGLTPAMVMGRNAPELRPLLRPSDSLTDDLKHLADCLDLYAKATEADGRSPMFARVHAMKFYDLAHAPESLLRVGQDLADEFVARNDFVGARQVIETNLLPLLGQWKLAEYIIPVRSQYAVILAYCGDFQAAEDEMARLSPYQPGLSPKGQIELQRQSLLIAQLRKHGPPPQWQMPEGAPKTLEELRAKVRPRKIGRNELCPCGSGKKYKRCHG